MSALFSATELTDEAAAGKVGNRLERLELLNWGTFDAHVWTFTPGGANGLLTGDIGSGKSTVIDALTTLLVAPAKVAFNRAAGAQGRERDLRSYVLGHYKSERNEATGASRPVGLRRGPTFSVLLAVFANAGYDSAVTLAEVLWLPEGHSGQPDRFYVTAEQGLSITEHFTGFGTDPAALRKRLKAGGAQVDDGFSAYSTRFRRLLGIESAQAMELFHQTVSMKAVSDLNGFVRQHMLEPFDAVSWTDRLISHFESLSRAHEAVVAARTQLADLAPLLGHADRHAALNAAMAVTTEQLMALGPFVAVRKAEVLRRRVHDGEARLEELAVQQVQLDAEIGRLTAEHAALQRELEGSGGGRLREIATRVAELTARRTTQQRRADEFATHLRDAGLAAVDSPAAFAARREDAERENAGLDAARTSLRETLDELAVASHDLTTREQEVNAELRGLRERRSNIPSQALDLRGRLVEGTGLSEEDLPFAGELIQVRGEHAAWEGAAERVLRGFGLSLLVPERHYAAVSDWIDAHHLRARLVYYRVPARMVAAGAGSPRSRAPLSDVLEVRDGPMASWVGAEVAVRADLERVETTADLRQASRAVTRAGQVKGRGGRHEKNDTTRIDDRRSYVLGWSPEAKIDALLDAASGLGVERAALNARSATASRDAEHADARRAGLARVLSVTSFDDIDVASIVGEIDALQTERRRLEESSGQIRRLQADLEDAGSRLRGAGTRRDDVLRSEATTQEALDADRARLRDVQSALAGGASPSGATSPPAASPAEQALTAALAASRDPGREPDAVAAWDRWEKATSERLYSERGTTERRLATAAGHLTNAMHDVRGRWPLLTAELDEAVEAVEGYRALHARLVEDDLPRFEADFQDKLRTNAIRDIAGFHAELRKQESLISERVDTINDSLAGIDYNPGRYIRLEFERTPNTEIRTFISELRACTDDALGASGQQYSEEKFHQVRAIIERFRGRDGSTDLDRAWTTRVTDVRNWVVFSAVERRRSDDGEHETYTDSAGKSGGQKEKLAYTILAASLAYQFKLAWGATRSRAFHVAVIDEAFGRGSDESTRFALSLFRRLGLQLVIVTPLQKIHTIEPFVEAVGFVDNPTGAGSRIRNLSIEEFRTERATRQAARGR